MNPVEIAQAIILLEPLVQKGLIALIHEFHTKPLTPEDFIAQAQALLAHRSMGKTS